MTGPRLADLSGRTCLVTGATNGHGRAVAHALALRGADLVLLGRSPARLAQTRQEIAHKTGRRPDLLECDLSSRDAVRSAAETFLGWERPLHVLVNNAGIVNQKRLETVDGIEMVLAVNYLAQYHLTLRLLPRLTRAAPARIVNVSSDAHRMVPRLDPGNLELRRGYNWWFAYGHSKQAVTYFTLELARRLAGTGVTVNAVDPGPVASNIAMNNRGLVVKLAGLMIRYLFPSPERAARTALWLAASPEAAGLTGGYYKYLTRREPRLDRRDPLIGPRLWEISARLTGASLPG